MDVSRRARFGGVKVNLNVKKTRKQVFLEQMEHVVPWSALIELIEPYYPQGKMGRPPFSLQTMLRVHFMHVWTRRLLQAFFCDVQRSAHMYTAC